MAGSFMNNLLAYVYSTSRAESDELKFASVESRFPRRLSASVARGRTL